MFALFAAISLGAANTYASPIKSTITTENDDFYLTVDQFKYFVGLFSLGAMTGSITAAPINDGLGRRKGMMLGALLFGFSLSMIALSKSASIFYFGRYLMGISCGILVPSANLYISEISPTKIRGALTSSLQIFVNAGQFLVSVVGAYVTRKNKSSANPSGDCDWRVLAWLLALPAAALFFGILLVGLESPLWLAKKSTTTTKAMNALALLRGGTKYILEQEKAKIEEIVALNVAKAQLPRSEKNPMVDKVLATVEIMKRNRRSLSSAITVLFFRLAIGFNLLNFYTETIFQAIVGSKDLTLAWSCGFAAFGIVAACFSPYALSNFGRKQVYITCCIIFALGYIATAIGLFVPAVINLAVVGLFLAYGAFSVGCGPIPFVLGAELLSNEARAIGVGIGHASYHLVSFVVGSTLPDLERDFGGVERDGDKRRVGLGFVFIMYAGVALIAATFVGLFVPETKSLTFDQIQKHFEPKINSENHATVFTSRTSINN
jgi:MFS family permease